MLDADVEKTSGGADGNIGAAGTTPGGIIRAHNITLRAAGNLTAYVDVLSTAYSHGLDYDIELIEVDGNLLGTIDGGGRVIRRRSRRVRRWWGSA